MVNFVNVAELARSQGRVGYLTNTVPADMAARQAFGRDMNTALADPAVFTFPRDEHTVVVRLGTALYCAGWHAVAYQVEFSATGEIFAGMDYMRDYRAGVRDERAAVELVYALGLVAGDDTLCDFASDLLPA